MLVTYFSKAPLFSTRIVFCRCTTELECGAVYGGVITVADAMGQVIEGTGMTLCGLMSGDKGIDPSDPHDDCLKESENWPNPPDAQYEGAPAFSIRTCFSAEQVMLAGN